MKYQKEWWKVGAFYFGGPLKPLQFIIPLFATLGMTLLIFFKSKDIIHTQLREQIEKAKAEEALRVAEEKAKYSK